MIEMTSGKLGGARLRKGLWEMAVRLAQKEQGFSILPVERGDLERSDPSAPVYLGGGLVLVCGYSAQDFTGWDALRALDSRVHVRRRVRMHRARASGRHTDDEWRAVLAAFAGQCAWCGTTKRLTKDHIVPVSAGGSDSADNLQPLCRSCNGSKGAKTMEEWVGVECSA